MLWAYALILICAWADQTVGSASAPPAVPAPPLAAQVAQLNHCEPAKQNPEAAARSAAAKANISRTELLARLIYAETLSSGFYTKRCAAPSADKLMTEIGWGILNRVAKKRTQADAYAEAIFQKNQFTTSFTSSDKKPNPFAKAFLCPPVGEDFTLAMNVSAAIVEQFERQGLPEDRRGISNFFYPRSEYYGEMRPKWAKEKDPRKNKGYMDLLGMSNPCAEFYRL